ncbi:hypothetical protein F5X97DRAFT_318793 [Nemania serpens]|nr:hypothetical protein F5X97DRAFT_318793 [Nemania serpens]
MREGSDQGCRGRGRGIELQWLFLFCLSVAGLLHNSQNKANYTAHLSFLASLLTSAPSNEAAAE